MGWRCEFCNSSIVHDQHTVAIQDGIHSGKEKGRKRELWAEGEIKEGVED